MVAKLRRASSVSGVLRRFRVRNAGAFRRVFSLPHPRYPDDIGLERGYSCFRLRLRDSVESRVVLFLILSQTLTLLLRDDESRSGRDLNFRANFLTLDGLHPNNLPVVTMLADKTIQLRRVGLANIERSRDCLMY